MYKIIYIPTGHLFELPETTANNLKKKYPEDYKIIEKNGKKFKDKIIKKNTEVKKEDSILSRVKDE